MEVNGTIIGIADDWDGVGGGQKYLIRVAGEHYARFTLAGYEPAWVKIVISPNARDRFCDVDTKLKKAPKATKSEGEEKVTEKAGEKARAKDEDKAAKRDGEKEESKKKKKKKKDDGDTS